MIGSTDWMTANLISLIIFMTADYLLKYESITNKIAILDRSLIDIGDFMSVFCATAVWGHHITGPFHRLLDVQTSYSWQSIFSLSKAQWRIKYRSKRVAHP